MLWIYNLGILLYRAILRLIAPFNKKAKLFIDGRAGIFNEIAAETSRDKKYIWFHFASLGEFEQGRPVLEGIKLQQPEKNIIITFFSPSGYEVRKNYKLADAIFYLPLDTAINAKRFTELVDIEIAVFTKYEFWHHYFKELKTKGIPIYLISGNFRKDQIYFKWYGDFYKRILQNVKWFYLQNEYSKELLNSIGLQNTSVSGDTRFDRVASNAAHPVKNEIVAKFCGKLPILVCGSTWPIEEKLLAALPQKYPDWKFVIAPHEIDSAHIDNIADLFPDSIRYSMLANNGEVLKVENYNTLIIDNVGMLSSLYQYGRLAYIGGAFGSGLHNILEAAAFGLPVIFGPKTERFPESLELINAGGGMSISNENELLNAFIKFKQSKEAAAASKRYVAEKQGATEMILKDLPI